LEVACLDLEGVLIPEIWINVAERTGIDGLRATTRDIPDYDVLMGQRLGYLEEQSSGLLQEHLKELEMISKLIVFLLI